jgi:diguanylate cyclase (GGDEF)-like protein
MTRGDRRLGTGQSRQATRLRDTSTPLRLTLIAVEILAGVLFVAALLAARSTFRNWVEFAVLLALSVVFEEVSRQVGKQRLLINNDPHPDMTSVWTFAAALTLPAGTAALLAVVIAGHVWIREQRSTGKFVYRKVYSAATVVLACLASSAVVGLPHAHPMLAGARSAALIIAALLVYTAVNRLLITVAMVLSGAPRTPAALLGRWDDYALELATLCLGYLIAVVVLDQAWLAAVALLPMVLLQRGALVRQLEETATRDTKTQLLNALAWRQYAHRELVGARGANAAVLVIDLDRFKAVNDTHGHLVGDAALYEVGRSVTQELRQGDLVGRFGGEEFVVMLPGLDSPAAHVIAERLRLRIASIRLADLHASHVDGATCTHALSASIGVAVCPRHGTDLGELLAAADAALYVAKRGGRDRVVLADHDAPDPARSAASVAPDPDDAPTIPLAG